MLNNESFRYVDAAARTGASFEFAAQTNLRYRGGHFVIKVTTIPGASTATPTIQAQDPASGDWYDLLVGTAIASTGTTVLKVLPGISPLAGGAANDGLPPAYRIKLDHSNAGAAYTYSVGVNLLG